MERSSHRQSRSGPRDGTRDAFLAASRRGEPSTAAEGSTSSKSVTQVAGGFWFCSGSIRRRSYLYAKGRVTAKGRAPSSQRFFRTNSPSATFHKTCRSGPRLLHDVRTCQTTKEGCLRAFAVAKRRRHWWQAWIPTRLRVRHFVTASERGPKGRAFAGPRRFSRWGKTFVGWG